MTNLSQYFAKLAFSNRFNNIDIEECVAATYQAAQWFVNEQPWSWDVSAIIDGWLCEGHWSMPSTDVISFEEFQRSNDPITEFGYWRWEPIVPVPPDWVKAYQISHEHFYA